MAAVNILPESLHPALTRSGFAGSTHIRNRVDRSSPEDYPTTEHGLWLPPFDLSDEELIRAQAVTAEQARKFSRYKDLAHVIGETLLVDKLGCWSPDIDIQDQEHIKLLRELAENERMRTILDEDSEFSAVKLCDTKNCLSTRHYDFTYGTGSQRKEIPQLSTDYYLELPNGNIQTAWLDELPSLRESARRLYDLQHRCVPYVRPEKSILTGTSISHISFNITTGCWEVSSFYNKPSKNKEKIMFGDGYGRLYMPSYIDANGVKRGGRAEMAHRVIWWVMNNDLVEGYVVNHFCSNRMCCFDGHTEETTQRKNTIHGVRTQKAELAVRNGILIKTSNGFEPLQQTLGI